MISPKQYSVTSQAQWSLTTLGIIACTVIVSLVLGVYGMNLWFTSDMATMGMSYPQILFNWQHKGGFTVTQFWGLALGCLMLPLGGVAVIVLVNQLFTFTARLKVLYLNIFSAIVYLGLTSFFLFAAHYAYDTWDAKDILKCGVLFCIYDHIPASVSAAGGPDKLVIKPGFGTVVFFLCLHMAFLLLVLAVRVLVQLAGSDRKSDLQDNLLTPSEDTPQRATRTAKALLDTETTDPPGKLAALFVFLCLFPLFAFLSTALPSMFEGFSAYEIRGNILTDRSQTAEYASSNTTMFYSKAYAVHDGDHESTGEKTKLYFVVFPDVLMFWLFIYGIAAVGLLSRASITARRVLRTRIAELRIPLLSSATPFTVGQCLLFTIFALTFSFYTYYWKHDHAYHGGTEPSGRHEVWARTFGQMANLVMGMLILPVARNSIWTTVFGVSWESTLKVHIYLGYSLCILVASHAACWWGVWQGMNSEIGKIYPENIFRIRNYYPNNHATKEMMDNWKPGLGLIGTSDNFTIALATYTTLVGALVFGVLTHYKIRRNFFELFYYSHYFFLVVFVMVLWHANSSWFFILPGLTLWFYDRCLRTAKSNATTRFVTLKPEEEAELTILEFEQTENFFGCPFRFGESETGTCIKGMKFRAGQYIFLNVPIISPLQWHPFTISSAPSDGRTTCHIKDMGPGTFTHQLRQLAQQAENKEFELGKMPIAVDGPYGAPLPVRDYKKLVLVAGGIGITPVNSILREMYRSALENQADKDRWSKVLLVWVVRETSLLQVKLFNDTLKAVAANDMDGRFEIKVFVTRGVNNSSSCWDLEDGHLAMRLSSMMNFGRPDLDQLLKQDLSEGGMDNLIFACGPESLITNASQAATKFGADFHEEVFEF